MAKRINESVLWNKNSDHFWKGGWQLYASFSQSFFLQFLKSQCPFGSKYPEFSKTPPTFAFWMSLRVVMAIFPRNDIFFGTPCSYRDHTLLRIIYPPSTPPRACRGYTVLGGPKKPNPCLTRGADKHDNINFHDLKIHPRLGAGTNCHLFCLCAFCWPSLR